jgi:hypothetical protein
VPRRKKAPAPGDRGGYGAQPAVAPTGMGYGQHQSSIESQRALPLAAVSPPGGPTGGPPAAPDESTRLREAVMAAKRLRPPAPLSGPSRRPGEPITAGMATGPGPGPEVLRTGDRVARTYKLLAEVTGNPQMNDLFNASLGGVR